MSPKNFIVTVVVAGGFGVLALGQTTSFWTQNERRALQSMHLERLGETPPDPSNRVADEPRAVALGHKLFFDVRLSSNGEVSCATCHDPSKGFTDQLPLAEGVATAPRNTPSVVGSGRQQWFFWDGRADSLWAQALGPLEAHAEHDTNRLQVAQIVQKHYRDEYEALFGRLDGIEAERTYPTGSFASDAVRGFWQRSSAEERQGINTVFVNVGKAMAAYQRRLDYGESRFDVYVQRLGRDDPRASNTLSDAEVSGLKLFIGKANCIECHSGAAFTDGRFHNTGVPRNQDLNLEDTGRASGLRDLLSSDFTCQGAFSDAKGVCAAMTELQRDLDDETKDASRMIDAFKTPSLRNVAQTYPYMHAGQYFTLRQVLEHYRRAPKANLGTSVLKPLTLSETEIGQLEAFLKTLSAPPRAAAELLKNPWR
jgi:cytochrome c peroxidase